MQLHFSCNIRVILIRDLKRFLDSVYKTNIITRIKRFIGNIFVNTRIGRVDAKLI